MGDQNLLFKATSAERKIISSVLVFPRLNRLLDESTDDILEQALGIIRDTKASDSDAKWLVPYVTPSRILSSIERALPSEFTSLATLFVLDHISTIPFIGTLALSRRRLLGHRDTPVRLRLRSMLGRLRVVCRGDLRELREVGTDARGVDHQSLGDEPYGSKRTQSQVRFTSGVRWRGMCGSRTNIERRVSTGLSRIYNDLPLVADGGSAERRGML
ncbi:hypothetical protein FRC07_007904 [Ceratobasidium sp. 392]|nr:hypothetical protein FRC07_007904 [Ceratobasidium sp. 392]